MEAEEIHITIEDADGVEVDYAIAVDIETVEAMLAKVIEAAPEAVAEVLESMSADAESAVEEEGEAE